MAPNRGKRLLNFVHPSVTGAASTRSSCSTPRPSLRFHQVRVTGNNRTKSSLVGLTGVVKKAVGLGGWHWLVSSRDTQKYPPTSSFSSPLARPLTRGNPSPASRNCPTDTRAGCRGTPSPSSPSPPATRSTRPRTTTTTRRRRSHPAGPAGRTKIKTRRSTDAPRGPHPAAPATGDPRARPRIGAKPTAWGSRSSRVNGASGAGRRRIRRAGRT